MIAKALLAHGSCVFCDNGRAETRFYVTLDKDADETIYACLRCVAKHYGPGVIELDTSDDARIILGVTSHVAWSDACEYIYDLPENIDPSPEFHNMYWHLMFEVLRARGERFPMVLLRRKYQNTLLRRDATPHVAYLFCEDPREPCWWFDCCEPMVAEAYVLGAKWLFHELQTKKQQLLDSGVTQVDFIGTSNTSQQFQIDGMADGVVVMSTLMLLTPNALDDVTKQMQAYLRGAGDALRAATGIKGMQRITN